MRSIRSVAVIATVTALASLSAGAPPSATTIVIGAAHGDTIQYAAGAAVPLTNTAFLVSTLGPDNTATTDDDETLLISDVAGTPVITALATPYLTSYSPRTCRVSATRALISHADPDRMFRTDDDGVYLLDALGTSNTVTSMTTGGIWTGDGMTPTSLSDDVAVVCTVGPDGAADTGDDTVAVLEGLGTTNTVRHLSAPYVRLLGQYRPVRLNDTSFLVTSSGPDGDRGTADDVIYLFTDLGGTDTRVDLPTPALSGSASGGSVLLSGTRALVVSGGDDEALGTEDDVVLLLDDLAATPTVRPIPVPNLIPSGAGVVVALTSTTAIVATLGADGDPGTADDALVLLSDVGSTNATTPIVVGRIQEQFASRPVRLSATSVALCTTGPDGASQTTDDQVAAVSDLGGANTVVRIDVPGLSEGAPSRIVRLSSDDVLLTSGGADGRFGALSDDLVTRISDVFGTPVVESTPIGTVDEDYYFSQSAQPLGAGRAVVAHTGADRLLGSGLDDGVTLLSGLPGGGSLRTTSLKITFSKSRLDKPESIRCKAQLAMDDPEAFGRGDLVLVIANARQTIPGTALSYNAKKRRYTYKDKRNAAGFVKSLVFDGRRGTLTVVGKAPGRANADAVEVSLASDDAWFAEVFAAAAKSGSVKYKAPK